MAEVSVTRFAALLGLSQSRVSRLIAAGMPAGASSPGKARMVNVRAAADWLIERAVSKVRTAEDGGESRAQAELRKTRADADAAERRVSQARAGLIEAEAVTATIDRLMALCAIQMDGLVDRVAPRLAGESEPAAIRQALLVEARAARSSIAAELEAAARVGEP
jgi:phage terminase Nu1 subunit (DNA packaging protein)